MLIRLTAATLSLLSTVLVSAQRETLAEAAVHAQELISFRSNSIATLISTYSPLTAPASVPKELLNHPIGLQEYVALFPGDGEVGDLLLLVLPISTIYANALPPNLDHSMSLSFDDAYGSQHSGSGGYMAAGRIRLSLFGTLEPIDMGNHTLVESCRSAYLQAHPEAKYWSGGSSSDPHYSFFARLRITSVYYFGGFGNVSYLGWIPLDLFHASYALRRSKEEVLRNWLDPARGLPREGEDGAVLMEQVFAESRDVAQGRFRIQG